MIKMTSDKLYLTSSESLQLQLDTLEKCISDLESATRSLQVSNHCTYLKTPLKKGIKPLYRVLDASKPWIFYWILNSLAVLGEDVQQYSYSLAQTLGRYEHQSGGIGGGYRQLPHLMPTYAGILALKLCNVDIESVINISNLRDFLYAMRLPDGSFKAHKTGEVDVRSCYCSLVVANLCDISDKDLFEDTSSYIFRCQTYEGGFAGDIGGEAHGGYTFCALGALTLLGPPGIVFRGRNKELKLLIRWLGLRQQQGLGGFNGRTNKLADGCYSYWIAASILLVQKVIDELDDDSITLCAKHLFNPEALKHFILNCCQSPNGGLRDKPGINPDWYHTNYCLIGLCIAKMAIVRENKEETISSDEKVTSDLLEHLAMDELPSVIPYLGIPV